MKVLKYITLTLLAATLLFSCTEKDHEEIAKNFLTAMQSADFTTAQSYCSEELAGKIEPIKSIADTEKPELKLELLSSKLDESKENATVFIRISQHNGAAREEPIALTKEGDEWKVSSADAILDLYNDDYPQFAVKRFHDAIKNMNFEKAKRYCTSQSAAMLDIAKSFVTEEQIAEAKKKSKDYKTEILSSTISDDGQTAQVVARILQGGEAPQEATIDLQREDGEWRVVIKK